MLNVLWIFLLKASLPAKKTFTEWTPSTTGIYSHLHTTTTLQRERERKRAKVWVKQDLFTAKDFFKDQSKYRYKEIEKGTSKR